MNAGFGQQDSITRLEEVLVSDLKLKNFSEGYKVSTLSDSVIDQNPTSLTSLLRFNSTIYFRENGAGTGVSSASFRGTGAAQTAVIWNGININSQLNGQTDFNTVRTANYDAIAIRSGGGSVQYGTGAIGGSVHLTNSFEFRKLFKNTFRTSAASFNTTSANYKLRLGTQKISADVGVDAITSDNDYKYLGTSLKNENGAYKNINLNGGFGYFLSGKNVLKVYQNSFLGTREFSGLLTGTTLSPSNDRYDDENTRTLITWEHLEKSYSSRASVAHLYEMYRYYDDKNSGQYDFGKSINWIAKYDFLYKLDKASQLQAIVQNSNITGYGSTIGNSENRNILSGILIFKHQLHQKFNYTINLRQEITNVYKDPILASIDAKFTPTSWYALKVNASRNYRIPTYNDLYWIGAGARGNPDLVPETSMQVEVGQEFSIKDFLVSIHAYYIDINDSIKWQPISGNVWSPLNIAETHSYGLETYLQYQKKWNQQEVLWQNNYAYTISEDVENDTQLIYVPFHKIASSVSYRFHGLSMFYQILYNGPVFITTDNTRELEGYDVSNLGVNYTFLQKKDTELRLGVTVNNMYNSTYQNVGFRPMPNRNYQIQVTFKF